jgi:hypothetical protein
VNTAYTQFTGNSIINRRFQHDERANALRGRQDNPTPPRDRTASPQPASLKKIIRPHPNALDTELTRPGRPKQRQTKPTTIHLKLRVSAALARKAAELGLSVSATGAALIEWALQQSIYQQNTATMDSAIDKGIGRHMKVHSDREASLLARLIQKAELIFQIDTQILSRQPGVDGKQLEELMQEADEQARASITRTTLSEKKVVSDEKAAFEKGGSINA